MKEVIPGNPSSRTDLEPRVARVETELEAVTRDIGTLTQDVRQLTTVVEKQFLNLHVAVERASAPRRTDWGTILSAVAVVLALTGAVLSPLYFQVHDLQVVTKEQAQEIQTHRNLDSHPVSAARLDALDDVVHAAIEAREKITDGLDTRLTKLEDRTMGLEACAASLAREKTKLAP